VSRGVVVIVAVAVVAVGAAVGAVALRSGPSEEERRIDAIREYYASPAFRQSLETFEALCRTRDCTSIGIAEVAPFRLVKLRREEDRPPRSWGARLREWCADLGLCGRGD
jgi:hypothetical protein